MTIWHLDRPDGRRVAVHELTPDAPAGAPVVLLSHAAPGSGAFDPDPAATAAAGVRLVAPDRPGYGGSDPVPGLTTVDLAADDAAAVLDHVLPPGDTAALAGWSAGGRVALAVAARRPELAGRVAVIGTPAPDEEVPWYGEFAGMIDPLRGLSVPDARAALDGAFGPMVEHTTGDARFALVADPEVDADLLDAPGTADRLRAMLRAALRQGGAGMAADVGGYTLAPWGFDPADVRADVLLAYGAADVAVGPEHGQWWGKALPTARLEVLPGVGHLLVVPFWEHALTHLTG
ncbi:alpha/beta fold hydrolase [Pseudonocardia abyssalis]|uniref:Alpha/beta hydrolase n=1 Tax=Pseudonocardia abyssalis TaxID=2792008 RepID=A0ABS6V0I1_9PSEU|nr:alpha/beta hydrolase [Pseudonocardia abyssalis]MBW0116188.1 alpha/beta hydrolase [Pseudonocardia abyssalis]MBW0137623.1 alpha/beta hydrolase [Pseudonocardia abyssalis]